ncbi:MAG: flagellar hook-length control protein FliK [Armatimonadota bacterium]
MTQAIAIQTPTPPGTAPPAPNMTSGEAVEGSPFAQLLMAFGQVADSGGGEPIPFAPADTLPPLGEKVQPAAVEAEQMMAMLGLAILPFSPLPTPDNNPPAQTSLSEAAPVAPAQVAIVPDMATDTVPFASVQKSQLPWDAMPRQALGVDEPRRLLQSVSHQPEAMPTPEHVDNLTPTAQGTPLSADATGSTARDLQMPLRLGEGLTVANPSSVKATDTGVGDTSRLSSESTADVQNAMNVFASPQRDIPARFQPSTEHERGANTPTVQGAETARQAGVEHVLTVQGAGRGQAKKTRLTLAEHQSTARPITAAPDGVRGAEFASALHRVPVHPTSPVAEASPAEVVRQVVNQIETMVHQPRADSVTLQLEPEHLGKLRVTISVSDGTIHTHIVADNHAVRQMLESNSTLLQQALQERGLQLGALQVSVQGDGRQFHLNQPYTPQRPTGGWAQVGAATVPEVSFGYTTAGGINLLV